MQLQFQNVTVSYNRIPALHHVSLQLPYGSCVGLLGPNGAGKTTFLKAIASLVPLETGSIQLIEKAASYPPLSSRSAPQFSPLHKSIAYVPQREAIDWDFPITVRALVEMGRYPVLGAFKAFGKKDHDAVEQSLTMMSLQELAKRQIKALSGGQQQRAFLARAWAQEANIYLLDEPFTGLDQPARLALADTLHQLRNRGKLIIASHHDFSTVPQIFDQIVIVNGELIAYGPTATTFTKENLDQAFSVPVFTGQKEEEARTEYHNRMHDGSCKSS